MLIAYRLSLSNLSLESHNFVPKKCKKTKNLSLPAACASTHIGVLLQSLKTNHTTNCFTINYAGIPIKTLISVQTEKPKRFPSFGSIINSVGEIQLSLIGTIFVYAKKRT